MSKPDFATLTPGNIVAFLADIFERRGGEEYLGEPVTMAEHMLQGAHFAENAARRVVAETYLARERVTHVLIATEGPLGRDLGGYLLFDTDVDAISADGRFNLLRSFGDDRLLLFEVVGP